MQVASGSKTNKGGDVPTVSPGRLASPDRLRALAETALVGSVPEAAFDRFSRLAARVLETPQAFVSLVDRDSQHLLSALGSDIRGTPPAHSLCTLVVISDELVVIEDATIDSRTHDHPTGHELGVVAFAGVPVRSPEGFPLGALCVVDERPRHWTAADLDLLHDLGTALNSEIALRVAANRQRTLAQTAAHTVRTPLAALQLQIEVLLAGYDDANHAAGLEAAAHQLGSLSDAVVELLTSVASSHYGYEDEVDLDELLRAVASQWSRDDRPGSVTVAEGSSHQHAVVPVGPLTSVVDSLIQIAVEQGCPAVTLAVVSDAVVRIEVRHDCSSLPSDVTSRIVRWRDHTAEENRPGDVSIAEFVSRRIGGRLLLRRGAFQIVLPGGSIGPRPPGS